MHLNEGFAEHKMANKNDLTLYTNNVQMNQTNLQIKANWNHFSKISPTIRHLKDIFQSPSFFPKKNF